MVLPSTIKTALYRLANLPISVKPQFAEIPQNPCSISYLSGKSIARQHKQVGHSRGQPVCAFYFAILWPSVDFDRRLPARWSLAATELRNIALFSLPVAHAVYRAASRPSRPGRFQRWLCPYKLFRTKAQES